MIKAQSKKIIVLITVILLAVIIYIVVHNLMFRVVSITPDPSKKISTSSSTFEISFNKEIEDYNLKDSQITDNQSVIRTIETRENRIYVYLKELRKEVNYEFTLHDISSKDGDIIKNISFNFTPVYIDFNDLSSAEQRLQIEDTDRGNIEEPIFNILPYSGLNYEITGLYDYDETGQGTITLIVKILLSNADAGPNRNDSIELYKKQLLDELRKKGFDPNDYTIVYRIIE